MGRLPRRFLSSWIKDVRRPRGRPFLSYWHDLARELRAVGFNLDRGAQAIGVSRDWVVVAQNRVAWRSLVAAGSFRSLDERQPEDDDSSSSSSEGSSSLMSSTAGLSAADANPSSSQAQGPLAGDHLTSRALWQQQRQRSCSRTGRSAAAGRHLGRRKTPVQRTRAGTVGAVL